MSEYVISYDLHRDRNYQHIYDLMDVWGAVRLHQSVWLVSLPVTAGAVQRWLTQAIDPDDSVVVLQLKPGLQWASYRLEDGPLAWLWRYLPRWWP